MEIYREKMEIKNKIIKQNLEKEEKEMEINYEKEKKELDIKTVFMLIKSKQNHEKKMKKLEIYQEKVMKELEIKKMELKKNNNCGNHEEDQKGKIKIADNYTGDKQNEIGVENPEDNWLNKMKKYDNKEIYDKTKNKLKLNIYKNGFILDNGEFRDYINPVNKKFINDIKKGYIPNELVIKGITDLGVELNDFNDEYYEPINEEQKLKAFLGLGKSISSVNTQGLYVDKNVSSNVDRSKPTCKINIRLFNGELVSENFNLSQTLKDVFNFVAKKSGSNNFSLLDGFPPRPLTSFNQTILELKLENSLLTQKIN